MGKISLILFILFVSLAHVQAQTKTPYIDDKIRSQLSLEVYASVGFTDYNTGIYITNTTTNTSEDVTVSFGSGGGLGFRYGTLISKKMQFSLGAYYQFSTISRELTNAAGSVSGGVSRVNFNPNLRYFINTKNKRSRFYGGAGLLISAGTTYKLKETDAQSGPIELNFKYKTSVGPTVEIGFEKFLRPFLSLDFTMKYHYLAYSLKAASNGGQTLSTTQLTNAGLNDFIKPDGQGMDFVVAVKYCF